MHPLKVIYFLTWKEVRNIMEGKETQKSIQINSMSVCVCVSTCACVHGMCVHISAWKDVQPTVDGTNSD